jgi:type II secretory pathway pseudopilin PulG
VVIVIIAILIAALTPAILGVINRANRSADESDARAVKMAATVAVTLTPGMAVNTLNDTVDVPLGNPVNNGRRLLTEAFGGTMTNDTTRQVAEVHNGIYTVFFRGPIGVGVSMNGTTRSNPAPVNVGDVPLLADGTVNPNNPVGIARAVITVADRRVTNVLFTPAP